MNRRGFLTSLIGGVSATAAVRTWPFRVYSFPTDIAVARDLEAEFWAMFSEAMKRPHRPYLFAYRSDSVLPREIKWANDKGIREWLV